MYKIYPKKVFSIRNEKGERDHWILNVPISLVIKFQHKPTILTFWTKCAQKGVSPILNSKNEHSHELRNSNYSKFQVKLKFLIFWTKLIQKGYFQFKGNESTGRILHVRVSLGYKF